MFRQNKINNRIFTQEKCYKSLLDKCLKDIVGSKLKLYVSALEN